MRLRELRASGFQSLFKSISDLRCCAGLVGGRGSDVPMWCERLRARVWMWGVRLALASLCAQRALEYAGL